MQAQAQSAWATFYEGRHGDDYLNYAKQRYAPFICEIAHRIHLGDTVLELGAGTGTITKALLEHYPIHPVTFIASDKDKDMRRILSQRFDKSNVSVIDLDAKRIPTVFADVVHSHGMLEHFDDHTIRDVIRAHSHARVQVHYVPGLYDEPTFGDERLLPAEAWMDICAPEQIIKFNDGLDYALIFERRK
jgi:cyclopropane fatty-acyl-phospholipid synthase-like methyltransferase